MRKSSLMKYLDGAMMDMKKIDVAAINAARRG
jgi:hypothetical protein